MRNKLKWAAALLTVCALLSSCTASPLTFGELQSMEMLREEVDQVLFSDLAEQTVYLEERFVAYSFLQGQVTDVRYYITWDAEMQTASRHALITLTAEQVHEPENGLKLTPGKTVTVLQESGIDFIRKDDFFAFVSEQTGKKIKSAEDMRTVENGTVFELKPVQGTDYRRYLWIDEPIVKPGETYTMMLTETFDEGVLYGSYMFPQSQEQQQALYQLQQKGSFSATFNIIAREIAALFA